MQACMYVHMMHKSHRCSAHAFGDQCLMSGVVSSCITLHTLRQGLSLEPKLSDWIILLSSLPWGCLPSTENRGWLPHLPCINTVLGIWTLVLLSAQQMLYLLGRLPCPQLYSFTLDFTFLCPTQITISVVVKRNLSAPTVKWMVPLQMFISVTWHKWNPLDTRKTETCEYLLGISPWVQSFKGSSLSSLFIRNDKGQCEWNFCWRLCARESATGSARPCHWQTGDMHLTGSNLCIQPPDIQRRNRYSALGHLSAKLQWTAHFFY